MRRVYGAVLNDVPFLPYGLGALQAYALEDPEVADAYAFAPPFFLVEPVAAIAARVEDPAVLALSCYVWNFRRQMKLARRVKERDPGCLVVAGGPHVPDRPEGFFEEHPYVDVLVHGEGEIPFQRLLRQELDGRRSWETVPGISFRHRGSTVSTARGVTLARSIESASPYLAGFMDASVRTCRDRALRFYAPWETNRGCPYSCAFCDWGSATMSKVRRFPDERLAAEIDWFAEHEVANVFICDANFGILKRDLGLAEGLTARNLATGFPKQVRVNFAKSSNDRVFDISALWARHDMLMGTTLSMQSTDMAVLEAIDRANIGLDNYRALKDRYARARIHTYTELILGLPRETRSSFERGIGSLLEAGNHEDIRVYEFTLLPNAPINTPERRAAHALRTIPKRLYVQPPGTEPDELETTELVVETAAMSSDDWVACALYSTTVQTLHNGCWTRYLSIYLRREHDLAYADFYAGLIDAFLVRPDTVLGAVLGRLRALYRRYQGDPALPQANLVASQPDMVEAMRPYGRRRGWAADEWAWLRLSEQRDRLHEELAEHVRPLAPDDAEALDEVLRFQREIMLAPEYDPRRGKRCELGFDLPAYFDGAPLRRVETVVELLDERMGVNRQYPLVAGDLRRFAKAAVGESYPFSRIRHYQHQLSAARIERRPVAAHA